LVTSLEGLFQKATWNESILASTATGFGAVTLVFTCVGLYALISLAAAALRREIGIRIALGADRQNILQSMLKDAAGIIGVGACGGIVVTVLAAPVYRSFLYGIAQFEPMLMSASVGIVVLSALMAALVPAWRATRVDPGSVLRLDG
jgi:putative ABC transport system permease protein